MLYVWLWIRLYCYSYFFFWIVHESTWCLFAVCCLKARMSFLRDYSRHYLVSLGHSVDETCKEKNCCKANPRVGIHVCHKLCNIQLISSCWVSGILLAFYRFYWSKSVTKNTVMKWYFYGHTYMYRLTVSETSSRDKKSSTRWPVWTNEIQTHCELVCVAEHCKYCIFLINVSIDAQVIKVADNNTNLWFIILSSPTLSSSSSARFLTILTGKKIAILHVKTVSFSTLALLPFSLFPYVLMLLSHISQWFYKTWLQCNFMHISTSMF